MRDNTTQLFFLLHIIVKKNVVSWSWRRRRCRKENHHVRRRSGRRVKRKSPRQRRRRAERQQLRVGSEKSKKPKVRRPFIRSPTHSFFFLSSQELRTRDSSSVSFVVRFQRALNLRYRLALDASLRVLERFSREFRSSVRSTRNGRSHERTNARITASENARTRAFSASRETLFFIFLFQKFTLSLSLRLRLIRLKRRI